MSPDCQNNTECLERRGPKVQGGDKNEDTFELCINWTDEGEEVQAEYANAHKHDHDVSVRTGGMATETKGMQSVDSSLKVQNLSCGGTHL